MAFPILFFFGVPSLLVIWIFYGFAIHPLFTGEMLVLWFGAEEAVPVVVWGGWLLFFPCAALLAAVWYWVMYPGFIRSSLFTYARGRIRFNRITRKVYVLRPKFAGGNAVFDWDRTCAVLNWALYDVFFRRHERNSTKWASLVLYYPPLDPKDPQGEGEDCLFVGPELGSLNAAAPVWEYIRRYMEHGPGRRGIPRHIPQEYTTFCGKPSANQYKLEEHPGFMETTYLMLGLMTCSWPKFPTEWQSDSGIGEPEDKPVQTGAVMTAMVYRAEGNLSAEDEVEFLTHWGTDEALAEAKQRLVAQVQQAEAQA